MVPNDLICRVLRLLQLQKLIVIIVIIVMVGNCLKRLIVNNLSK